MIPKRTTKKCPGCQKELPLTAFYRNRTKGDGLTSYCKECTKTINLLAAEKRKATAMIQNNSKSTPTDIMETSSSNPVSQVQNIKSLKDYTPRELLAELKARGYVLETMYKKEYVSYSKI